MKRGLILGHGYVGKALSSLDDPDHSWAWRWTSRRDSNGMTFDFERRETWSNLPHVDATVWMFPVVDLQALQDFWQECGARLGRIVVVGSTGQIMPGKDGDVVTEKSPRDLSVPRALCEDFLQSQEANLVSSSGIYGPGRSPLDWVRKGYVGKSDKLLNAVHVQDLCKFILRAVDGKKTGQHYLASDGAPQSWRDIIEFCLSQGWLAQDPGEKASSKHSKNVDSTLSRRELQVELCYPDIYAGLRSLHGAPKRI